MSKQWIMVIVGVIALVIIAPFFVMFFWSWTVPDVFAGMVENHLLPASITYTQAIKLLGFMATLGIGVGVSGSLRSNK